MNSTRFTLCVSVLALAFLMYSCSSIEIFKENAEIPIRKKYDSFVIMNQEVGMSGFTSQMIDQQVQTHLQESLTANGLEYDKAEPDLVIRYTSNEDLRQREIRNNYNPYPYWGYRVWDPWMYNPYAYNNTKTSNYELVQVIVDFIDPKEDKLLMTLTGVTEVSSQKSKSNKILKTTDKIISYFLNDLNSSVKE